MYKGAFKNILRFKHMLFKRHTLTPLHLLITGQVDYYNICDFSLSFHYHVPHLLRALYH